MEDRNCDRTQAEQYVVKKENDHKAFIRKYFNSDDSDPRHYDIVMNTGSVSIADAAAAIKVAFRGTGEEDQVGMGRRRRSRRRRHAAARHTGAERRKT
jgi:cytidylate kinase